MRNQQLRLGFLQRARGPDASSRHSVLRVRPVRWRRVVLRRELDADPEMWQLPVTLHERFAVRL